MATNNRNPTMKDVAKLAGVSVATVSFVLNNVSDKYIREELRQKVLDAANALHYRPNLSARRMKGKSGKFIAILVPQFENVYFNRIVIGAENYANLHDYTLSIYSTYDDERRELRFINNLLSHQVDGILICPSQANSESLRIIRSANIPYVVVDRPVPGHDFDMVTVDNYDAAYQGTKLLIQNGHQSIAYIGWKSSLSNIQDRVDGFLDAVDNRKSNLVFEIERSSEAAFELTLKIFQEYCFTAVFIGLHHLGEGVINALKVLKKKIPDDISVLIFGNPNWTSMTEPPYTCIAQPDIELGQKAAELIIDRLENPNHKTTNYILQTKLILRDSIKKL